MENVKRKSILQIFLVILVMIEILGGYLFFNPLTLEVTTDGYGKTCDGFVVTYITKDDSHQMIPSLDHTEKKFSVPLLKLQDAREIESITIGFKIYEKEELDNLELLRVSKIKIKSGVFHVVGIGYAFTGFLETCNEMSLIEPELFQLDGYHASLVLNNQIIKIAIQRIKMVTMILLGAFFVCIAIIYRHFFDTYKEEITLFTKINIFGLGIWLWIQNSNLEGVLSYFILIGFGILCTLLYCRIKHRYIYLFISVYSLLMTLSLWNHEFAFASWIAVILIAIANLFFVLFMKQSVSDIWRPYIKKKRRISIDCFIVVILVMCYGLLLSYNLTGNHCYNNDEKYVLETAAGYIKCGELRQWDFVNKVSGEEYLRASIYTYLVAAAFNIWGISIEVARSVSVILGMLFIGIFYVILRKEHFSRQGTVVCSILLMINPNMIVIFRTARMYCLLMPLSFLTIYFAYKALTCRNKFIRKNVVTEFISIYVDFHWGYALAFLFMLYLSCWCMLNSIVIVIGIYLFVLYLALTKREKKYIILAGLGIGCLVVVAVLYLLFCIGELVEGPLLLMQLLYNIKDNLTVRSNCNFSYVLSDLSGFGSEIGGMILFLFATVCIWWKTKENMNFVRYLWFISIGSYVFFVFFANKSFQYRYMCFVQPICYILVVFVIYRLKIYSEYQSCRYLLLSGVTLLCLNVLCGSFNAVYGKSGLAGSLNAAIDYVDAINVIKDDSQVDSISLFPSWYQSFYLQDFREVNLKAEYMYDERDTKNLEMFGGYNIDYFINSIASNEEGYITLETPKLYMWMDSYNAFSKLFEKIAGQGLDIYNLEVFKYNVLYPQNEFDIEDMETFKIEDKFFDIKIIEKEDGEKKLFLNVDKTALPTDTEMVSIVILTEEKEYVYQLIINEKASIYITELEDGEVTGVGDKIVVYKNGEVEEFSCSEE